MINDSSTSPDLTKRGFNGSGDAHLMMSILTKTSSNF